MTPRIARRIGWCLVFVAGFLAGCRQAASDHLESQVAKADKPVLVKFYSPECPYCIKLAPVFDALTKEYAGRVEFTTINTDVQYPAANRHNVSGIPTVLLFINGQEQQRWEGQLSPQPYREALNRALSALLLPRQAT
jgi:thioredoxin-like negative regulator of GroEL